MRSSSGRITGALIGGTFGGVFVLANASTPLGAQATAAFRILAIAGLVGLYLTAGKARRQVRVRQLQVSRPTSEASVNLFGRRYWLIVIAEAALLGLGIGLLRAFGTPQPTDVAWITLIVGLHFIAFRFAGVWKYSITRSAVVLTGLRPSPDKSVSWVVERGRPVSRLGWVQAARCAVLVVGAGRGRLRSSLDPGPEGPALNRPKRLVAA